MNRTVTLTRDGKQIRVTPQQADAIYIPQGWAPDGKQAKTAETPDNDKPAPSRTRKKD